MDKELLVDALNALALSKYKDYKEAESAALGVMELFDTYSTQERKKNEGIGAYLLATTVLMEMAPLMVHKLEEGFPSMTGEVIGNLWEKVRKCTDENEQYMRSTPKEKTL